MNGPESFFLIFLSLICGNLYKIGGRITISFSEICLYSLLSLLLRH